MEIPFPGYSCGDEDLKARLEARREQIARFELRDPAEALLECFTDALARLTPDEIATLRAEVVRSSPASSAFVEIIDGHLALREIAGAS